MTDTMQSWTWKARIRGQREVVRFDAVTYVEARARAVQLLKGATVEMVEVCVVREGEAGTGKRENAA